MTLTDASNQRPDVLEKIPVDIGLPLPPPPPPPAPVNRGPIEVIDLTLSDSESSSAEDDDEDDDRFHDGMLASEQSEPGTTRDGDRDEGGDDDGDDEEGEYVEIPVDATARAKLRLAISSVSEAKLRQMILDLVDSVPAVEEALLRELITVQRDTRAVVARFETCANCDQEYDVGVENEENCCFHPGELEVKEDEFVDWDERCHGPMDTLENRRSYPENFEWTCCEDNATSEGCVRAKHKPAIPRKRRRV